MVLRVKSSEFGLAPGFERRERKWARTGCCHADPKAAKLFAAQPRSSEDVSRCYPVDHRRRRLESKETRVATSCLSEKARWWWVASSRVVYKSDLISGIGVSEPSD
jgi:hypothetical protein